MPVTWLGIDARDNEIKARFTNYDDANFWANEVEYPVKLVKDAYDLNWEEGRWSDGKFEDVGCGVSDRCLECPLPVCVFDVSARPDKMIKRARMYRNIQQIGDTYHHVTRAARKLAALENMTVRGALNNIQAYNRAGGDFERFVLGS